MYKNTFFLLLDLDDITETKSREAHRNPAYLLIKPVCKVQPIGKTGG